MKTVILIFLITLATCSVWGVNLTVGDLGQGADLAHNETVNYNGVLLKRREKFYFYSQPDNRKIRGINVVDNIRGNNSVEITAGGVGHSFVNFRLASERGARMDYWVEIYVDPIYYLGSSYN